MSLHRGVSETSRQAYREIQPVLQPMELRVLAAFRGDEHLRMTRQRIAAITNMPLSSVCGRVNSLIEKGQLAEYGKLRETETSKARALVGLNSAQAELFA